MKIGTKVFLSFVITIVMILSITVTVIVTNIQAIDNIHNVSAYNQLQLQVSNLHSVFKDGRIRANMLYERYDDETFRQFEEFVLNAFDNCGGIYVLLNQYDYLEKFEPDIKDLESRLYDWHDSVSTIRDVNVSDEKTEAFISQGKNLTDTITDTRAMGDGIARDMNSFAAVVISAAEVQMKDTVSIANTALIIVLCVTIAALIVISIAMAYRYTIDAMSESIGVFKTIFTHMEGAIIVISPDDDNVLFANSKAKMLGDYNAEGNTYWDMFHGGNKPDGILGVMKSLKSLKTYNPSSKKIEKVEYEMQVHGENKWYLSQIMVIPWKNNDPAYLETIIDITEQKKAEKHMESLAAYDKLTGMYSRNYGLEQLEKQLISIKTAKQHMTIGYFDLDGLKHANDTYGHAEGDRYLKTTADTIRECVHASDLVIRMGGDEFLTAFPKLVKPEAQQIIDRFNQKMKAINQSGEFPYHMRASIGLYEIRPDTNLSLTEIIEEADKIMYQDKLAGKAARKA